MKFIAGIGNAKETELELRNVQLLGGTSEIIEINGKFKLLGICPEGGSRLLNPEGDVQLFSINPNPASDAVDIEFELIEIGRTQLNLSNILGERVQTLYEGIPELGRQTIRFSTCDIPTGTYFVILKTPTLIKTQRIEVMK